MTITSVRSVLGDDSLTLETEDGSISVGGGQDLPGRLELPVFDGGDTVSVFELSDEIAVVLSYPEDAFATIEAFYESQMEGRSGFEHSSFEVESADGVKIRNVAWLNNDANETVTITTCPDFTGGAGRVTCVTLIQP